jgi:hypothetical protein
MHVIGGGLLGSQILPAQAVGGVFQVTSILGSAGFTIVRVRKYMKKVNASTFAPRGLTVRLMSTKKMMAAIHFDHTDAKGKLKLPPLDDVSELDPFIHATHVAATDPNASAAAKEDPRLMRLKALEDYVAPLTFDVPENTAHMGPMNKYGGAPLRWMNKKQLKKLDKAREKSLKKREEKAPEVEKEVQKSQGQIADLEQQITVVKANVQRASMQTGSSKGQELMVQTQSPAVEEMTNEIHALENIKLAEEEKRDQAIKEIHQKGDKKLMKVYKKEEKIANRILWVVIMKEGSQGTTDDDLVHVDSA